MDITLFVESRPGRLVPIENDESAFVPNPLPPKELELDPDQCELLSDAREVIGELRGVTSLRALPNPGVLLRALQREESLRSSSIEGLYVTAEDLLRFELKQKHASNSDGGKWREVHNADLALKHGTEHLESKEFDKWFFRAVHQTLMEETRGEEKSPGEFREGQVYIGSSGRFIPPPGYLVEQCMDELISFTKEESKDLHGIIKASLLHYQFETIHPFRDGNGRVGRLVFALMLAKWCNLSKPWIYLSEFFEKHKDEYVNLMFNVSAKNDWESWINFCLRAVAQQGRKIINQCNELIDTKQQWTKKITEHELPTRCLALVEHLVGTPIIDTSTAQNLTSVSSPTTARKDLDQLADLGIIQPVAETTKNVYFAMDIIRIVHRSGDF